MSLQKYRADRSERQADESLRWYADWMGGPSLSKITNCRWESLAGEPRVTAYIQGESDTYFSIPAKCHYMGRVVTGYLTGDGDFNTLVFRHCYY